MNDDEVEMPMEDAMQKIAFSLDRLLNGDKVGTDPSVERRNGFILVLFPYGETNGRCNFISNEPHQPHIMKMFRRQLELYEQREKEGQMKERSEPFDVTTNMSRITAVMHEFRDGKIDRDETKRRLMEDCHVADFNLDQLFRAYERSDNDNEQ